MFCSFHKYIELSIAEWFMTRVYKLQRLLAITSVFLSASLPNFGRFLWMLPFTLHLRTNQVDLSVKYLAVSVKQHYFPTIINSFLNSYYFIYILYFWLIQFRTLINSRLPWNTPSIFFKATRYWSYPIKLNTVSFLEF